MQKLNIKTINPLTGKWEYFDLSPGTIIELKYESNPIGNLESRKSDESNFIKLPNSKKNLLLLGFPNEVKLKLKDDVMVNSVYKRNTCIVEVEGVKVFGKGTYFVISKYESDYTEIKIYSGMANFFTTLQKYKLSDLPEEGEYGIPRIKWSVEGTNASFISATDTPVPVMDWNVEDKPENLSDGDPLNNVLPEVQVSTLYPCVKLKKLMESICGAHGYTLQTDVEDDPLYLNTAVLCAKGAQAPVKEEDWNGCYRQRVTTPIGENTAYSWDISIMEGAFFLQNPKVMAFIFPANGTARFKVKMNSNGGKPRFSAHIFDIETYPTPTFIVDYEYDGIFGLTGEKDQTIYFSIENFFNGATDITELIIETVEFKQDFSDDQYPNNNFSVVHNLPDITQKDAFKQFVLMFGQMVYVDEIMKTVHCYGWNTVYNNRYKEEDGNLVPQIDWSGKLDNRHGERTFIFGDYGQNSVIKYKDCETVDDYGKDVVIKSEGILKVNNATLEETKDLFEFEATTVEQYLRFGWGNMAKIRYRENSQPAGDVPFTIVYLNNKGKGLGDIMTLNGIGNNDRSQIVQKIIYTTFQEIESQILVNRYYSKLQNCVLRKCKVITESVMLSAWEFSKFDNSVPIYLRKYNLFFYVNKIQYRGKLAKVELVALYPDIEKGK